MKKIIKLTIAVFFVLLSCILGYLLYLNKSNLKVERERNKALSEKMIAQTKTLGESELTPDFELIDGNGQKTSLEKVIHGKSKLVFRYKDSNTQTCIPLFKLLKDLSQQIGANNILLWTTSAKPFEAQKFSLSLNLEYPYFEVKIDQLNKKIENLNVPYFFIVNPQNEILYTFLPDDQMEDLTLQYLSQVLDYFKTTGQLNSIIQFTKSEIDLGKVKSGKKYAVDFHFVNKMNKPLVIFNVKTSCGCTVADWEKNPLKPNESSTIRVVYDAENRGAFTKSIRVSSNAENGIVELGIKGRVI